MLHTGKELWSHGYTFSAVYISEISHKSLRNRLGALPNLLYAFGFLMAYIMGYMVGWRIGSYISCGISFLSTFMVLILPETPYWLIKENKLTAAE